VNLFIVEKGTAGFEVGRKEDKMGARGIPSCPLFFDNVFVPEKNRLGGEGTQGFKVVMEAFNQSRPIMGARGVRLAQGALDHAVEFIKNRAAFGQQVSDFQGVRWMVADMAMQTEAARQLVYRAASLVDAGVSGRELAPVAAMAKCFATDVAMKVATDAVQLFGAAACPLNFPSTAISGTPRCCKSSKAPTRSSATSSPAACWAEAPGIKGGAKIVSSAARRISGAFTPEA
jgi:alkylation response protein AidB-like acyl-CoA dehydrogenase